MCVLIQELLTRSAEAYRNDSGALRGLTQGLEKLRALRSNWPGRMPARWPPASAAAA